MLGYKELDPSDVDIRTLFSRVAQEYGVEVEADESGPVTVLTVKATNRAKASAAIAELQDHLLYRPGEDNVWRVQLLIHPPKVGKANFTAVLKPREGDVGVRPTAATKESLMLVNPGDEAAAKAEYKDQLRQTLDHATRILRHTPNGMRMRVQFGALVLDEWTKGKVDYTFAELANLLRRAGPRGTARAVNM